MAVSKLSQINVSAFAPAAADSLVGVTVANADVLFSRSQLSSGILGNINAALATIAGTVFSATTTPAAAITTAQAGVGLTLTADAAVAGSSVAGAAAGGNVTITAGAAARFTSGNASGGNIVLAPGAGIGTGTAGAVQIGNGGGNTDFLSVIGSTSGGGDNGPKITATGSDATVDFIFDTKGSTSRYDFRLNGTTWFDYNAVPNAIRFTTNGGISASGQIKTDGNGFGMSGDNSWSRLAPSVSAFGNGTPADRSGWFTYGGTSRVATTDVTNATASLAVITGLSATLIAGRFYFVRLVVKCVNSVAAEGIQFDFNGGSATATAFWAGAGVIASGGTDVVGTNVSTTLAGVINFTTLTGESVVVFEGYIQCNAAGTFIPRFAENSHTAGTATVRIGSMLTLIDCP